MTTIIEKQEGILPEFDLERFVAAQKDCYPTVVAELKNGCKQTHWMWYIFPQIDGLGTSMMAKRFAIKSRDEAIAFLKHPILGYRLSECATLLLEIKGKTIHQILGWPDDLKLHSCMTLFTTVKPDELLFKNVLEKYYDNELDLRTIELLNV
jgi:uncharacterized protein (DUF1810 family)